MTVYTLQYRNNGTFGMWRTFSTDLIFSSPDKAQVEIDNRAAAHPGTEYRINSVQVR